jgi:hypothetical protein
VGHSGRARTGNSRRSHLISSPSPDYSAWTTHITTHASDIPLFLSSDSPDHSPTAHLSLILDVSTRRRPVFLFHSYLRRPNSAPTLPPTTTPSSSRHILAAHRVGAMQSSLPSWKDSKSQVQIPWRSIQLLVPHRLRRKIRSKLRNRQSPASSVTALQTSFSPADTLKALQQHKWTWHDGQWVILSFLGIFSLCMMESPGPLVKMLFTTGIGLSLILPITRQFFLPFMPIAAYLVWFYSAR